MFALRAHHSKPTDAIDEGRNAPNISLAVYLPVVVANNANAGEKLESKVLMSAWHVMCSAFTGASVLAIAQGDPH